MKKTIFEGVINGEKFNDVASYNSRMTALLSAGAKVDAQASTKTVEDENESGCDCCMCGCNHDCEMPAKSLAYILDELGMEMADLTPCFETDKDELVDRMLTDLNKVDMEQLDFLDLDSLEEILNDEEYMNGVNSAIDSMDKSDLKEYFSTLLNIVHRIERQVAQEQVVRSEHTDSYSHKVVEVQKLKNNIDLLESKLANMKKDYNALCDETNHSKEYLHKYEIFAKLVKVLRTFYRPAWERAGKRLAQLKVDMNTAGKTSIRETKPQAEANFAVGCGGDSPEKIKEKVLNLGELANDLSKFLGDLGVDVKTGEYKIPIDELKNIIPSPEQARVLFNDIFGNGAGDVLADAMKRKHNKK